jgi:hypothetical protein
MSGYIGTQPVPQATQTRDSITATNLQTVFPTSGYTPQFLDVYLNGIFLSNGADYTATNGSDVILASGAATGDILEVVAYSTFEVLNPTFSSTLDVASTAPEMRLTDLTDNGYSRLRYDGAAMFIEVDDGNTVAGSNFRIQVDGTEAMRITADSVMLVGTTGQLGATETSATGHDKRPDGTGVQVRDGNTLQYFNRLTSDGDIIDFRKDGVNVGSIGTLGGVMHLGSGDTFLRFQPSDDSVRPSTASGANRDNAIDLGDTSARFDDVYATNGTIQTSDATEKQDIASLTATEMLVGKRL